MVDQGRLKEVYSHIDSNFSKYTSDLIKLIEKKGVSAQGLGMEECMMAVRKLIDDLGFETQIYPIPNGYPVIFAKSINPNSNDDDSLLLYNHYDVQPVEPLEEWDTDPFSGVIQDGKLYGRGVADDKGDLVSRISALTSLKEVLGSIPISIKWVIEGEEEIGSPNFHGFVKDNKSMLNADSCIWEAGDLNPKNRPEFYLGCKGLLYVEISITGASSDRHSKYAAILESPTWRLISLIRSLKDEKGKIMIDGFYDGIIPPSGEEYKLISNIEFDEAANLKFLGAQRYLGDKKGPDLVSAFINEPTCNIAGLFSGYLGKGPKMILPSSATVKIDFRLVPGQEPETVLILLRRHLKSNGFSDAGLKVLSSEAPAKTPADSELVLKATEAARKIYHQDPVIWPLMPATGPMALFRKILDIPVAMVNCVAYVGSSYHSPNEHIYLSHYQKGIEYFATLLADYREKPE
ncbi:MAG: M20/M25/M40 family metallo-hydrolase [Thaumarchaeota archaeon]|nr:M20/M25/M40 family metallo-hydrolase [Nitrososphaerota archaeon]